MRKRPDGEAEPSPDRDRNAAMGVPRGAAAAVADADAFFGSLALDELGKTVDWGDWRAPPYDQDLGSTLSR